MSEGKNKPDYNQASLGADVDGAYLKEKIDLLNQNNVFKIEQKGKQFILSHLGNKSIPLQINSLDDAMEFRKYLYALDVKNQSCLKREELNRCILEKMENNTYTRMLGKNNEIYRAQDSYLVRMLSEPLIYQEGLPKFLKGEHAPANTVDIIKDYMNLVMTSTADKYYR